MGMVRRDISIRRKLVKCLNNETMALLELIKTEGKRHNFCNVEANLEHTLKTALPLKSKTKKTK